MRRRSKNARPTKLPKIPEHVAIQAMAKSSQIHVTRLSLKTTPNGERPFYCDGQPLIRARHDFTPRKSLYVVPGAPGTEIKNNETPKLQIADELPLGREITS